VVPLKSENFIEGIGLVEGKEENMFSFFQLDRALAPSTYRSNAGLFRMDW
jgi:hypothetical protein